MAWSFGKACRNPLRPVLKSVILVARSINYCLSVTCYRIVARWPDKRLPSHVMCLHQVMMTLNFWNDDVNNAESTQTIDNSVVIIV